MPNLDARGRFGILAEPELSEGFKWGGKLKNLHLSEKIIEPQDLN